MLNGLQTPFEASMRYLDTWGEANTYPHYHAGWAMAGNTPFRYFKQSEHRGGQHDALIVHWPDGIEAKGEIRTQYAHVSDIVPTIMEAARVPMPDEFHGVEQKPLDGTSMLYAFNDADAPNVKQRQYDEMFGNRAIWADGWKAVTLHANRMPWELNKMLSFDEDEWELYHVAEDFSESTDLAAEHPDKPAELIEMFDEEAWKYDVTTVDLAGGEEGVIIACGGMTGGYTMCLKDGRLVFDCNCLDGVHYKLTSPPLPTGPTELKFNFIKTAEYAGPGSCT